MPQFRRGVAAINQSGERSEGSTRSPFVPGIYWKDGDEKFLLFLNPAEEIPTVDLHEWIPVASGTSTSGKSWTRYEQFIARTDPAIGESDDPLADRLGNKPRARTLAVAVELEPTYTEVKGRKRPTGFEVKTISYERKTESGIEEVTQPAVGFITQSPSNFFNWVGSFSESTAPIEETPVSVRRVGGDKDTKYVFVPYIDQTVDLTNLLDYIDGISYLANDQDEVEEALKLEGLDAGMAIGKLMLEKRLNELADLERYKELVSPITHLEQRFGGGPTEARPVSQASSQHSSKITTGRQSDKLAALRARVEAQ